MRFVRLISLLTAALAVSSCFAAAPTDPPVPVYELHRWIEMGRIETLIVVVLPGSYSNVELENLAYYIIEGYGPREAVVVDDCAAAELAKLAERTDEQQAELDCLKTEGGIITEGFRIRRFPYPRRNGFPHP